MGCLIVWPSSYLHRLIKDDKLGFQINMDEGSWLVALMSAGRILGAVIGAIFSQYFGNRKGTLLSFVPFTLGWVIFMFAKSIIWADVARFVSGVGSGMTFCCYSLFIGEVTSPNKRGAVVSAAGIGIPLAYIITSVLGAILTLREFSLVFLIPCLLGIIVMFCMPDSPHYCIANGNIESAKRSLRWYRAYDEVDSELSEIVQYVESSRASSFWAKMNEFRTVPYLRKGLIIIIMLFIFQQATGLNSMMGYIGIILQEVKFKLLDSSLVLTIAYVISMITTIMSTFLIEKYGGRTLQIFSCIGVAISLIIMGTVYLLIKQFDVDKEILQWFPIISVFAFMVSYFVGMITVPGKLLGEIFPSNLKSIAGCFASLTGAISAFLSAKTYQPFVDLFGEAFVYYGHAGLALAALIFSLIYLPETKGKSLQEIQNEFLGNKNSHNAVRKKSDASTYAS